MTTNRALTDALLALLEHDARGDEEAVRDAIRSILAEHGAEEIVRRLVGLNSLAVGLAISGPIARLFNLAEDEPVPSEHRLFFIHSLGMFFDEEFDIVVFADEVERYLRDHPDG